MLNLNSIKLKKVCAVMTSLCFSVTLLSNNLFASISLDTRSEQKQYFSLQDNIQIKSIVSEQYGKIVSCNDNGSNIAVINIQDLHCDYSVQKNISFLLEQLSNQYNIEDVYVEGGVGNIDISFLSNINSDYREIVLEDLLKTGSLTGAEFYAITNEKKDLLKGVEDKKLHLQNIERLSQIINTKMENLEYLSKIKKEIEFLKAKYLKANNKNFNKFITKYEQGMFHQDKFFKVLFEYAQQNKININKYPNLMIYLGLSDGNKTIDNKKVTIELEAIIKDVKKNVSYKQYKKLLALTENLTDIKALKNMIEQYCAAGNINLVESYPNLNKFLSLKEKSIKFNPIELVKEERNLVDAIRTYLSEDTTDLEIAYISDFEKYFEGYLTASLTATQWEYVKIGMNKFKEIYSKYSISNDVAKLENNFEELNKFYAINTHRNEVFINKMKLSKNNIVVSNNTKNSPAQMLAKAKKIVVLVAGGYHTAGITDILNDNNISNITITPRLANVTEEARDNYEFLAQRQASTNQMIALGLLSNATQREQIKQITDSLFANQKLDGINITMLAEQLNRIFGQGIKVKVLEKEQKLEFTLQNGSIQTIDINEDIGKIVKDQNLTEIQSKQLTQITDEKLKGITDLVLKTTFNFGQGIFAPQIYKISREVCVFMVNNKWYLGNGAIWEIANSEYNGQTLDGVEPVIYEYMPESIQKALLEKQQSSDKSKSSFFKHAGKILKIISKQVISIILTITLTLSLTACDIQEKLTPQPTPVPITEIVDYRESSLDVISRFEDLPDYSNRYLTYDMSTLSQEDLDEWLHRFPNDFQTMSTLRNTYDQALLVVTLLKLGETEKARDVLNQIYVFYKYKNNIYKSNKEYFEILGEIIWVGIAAVQYKLVTGSTEFDELIDAVDEYLVERDSGWGFLFGSEQRVPINGAYGSTEHHLDALAYWNLKTLLPDNENIDRDKEMMLKFASSLKDTQMIFQTTPRVNYKVTTLLGRGWRDHMQVLDVYAWGVQVFLAVQKYNPEIYAQSDLAELDLQSLMGKTEEFMYVEDERLKETLSEEDYAKLSGYHLYTWSQENFVDNQLNISFEWSLQNAAAYYLMGDYKQAQLILDDAQRLSAELGFKDGIYPASNLNAEYNYSDYGWKVARAAALAPTCTGMMLEYAIMNADPELASPFFPVVDPTKTAEEPSSILPQTVKKINKLIAYGISTTKNILKEIIKKETKISLFNPRKFIEQHKTDEGKQGAKIVVLSGIALAISSVLLVTHILLPILSFAELILAAILELFAGYFLGITAAHTIVDFRYLKSIGLQEAVRLYGNENVSFSDRGLDILWQQKSVPMYIINDKPKNINIKEFDFKPISVKFKTKDGKNVKGWLGRYNEASVLFVDGAEYEDIAADFSKTRQFQTFTGNVSANVNIIEIDLNNADSVIRYSKSGNPLVGINIVKTNNIVDIQKEISLLNNKRVEAITINQNIAVFIDDDVNNIVTYNDLLSAIDLYVKNDDLGTDTKILFSDRYIDKILELIRQEVSKEAVSQEEIEKLIADKFIEIIQSAKNTNKEISVVFESVNKNTDLQKYFKYGIFSYIAAGKYFDAVTGTNVQTKIITDLNKIQGFDGSISIIKVSAFKKEIDSSSGIFMFLNSAINIKEILEKRNIEFVKQVAGNFDFNQMPDIDNEVVAEIILSADNKYEKLSKYLDETSSIAMYYQSLRNDVEKEVFVKSILERMLAVNLLKENGAYTGLREHKLEEILAKALLARYVNNISPDIKMMDTFQVDTMTAAEVEQKLMETVIILSDKAFVQNNPEAINALIELIPLYADRNAEFRTANVEVMNVKNIRGILSAA